MPPTQPCGRKELTMLEIYDVIRDWQVDARRLVARIAPFDANLAGHLRRSAQSVALNVAEGMEGSGATRRNCYSIALREARECMAVIEVAHAWEYLERVAEDVLDRLDRIIATLFRLVKPR